MGHVFGVDVGLISLTEPRHQLSSTVERTIQRPAAPMGCQVLQSSEYSSSKQSRDVRRGTHRSGETRGVADDLLAAGATEARASGRRARASEAIAACALYEKVKVIKLEETRANSLRRRRRLSSRRIADVVLGAAAPAAIVSRTWSVFLARQPTATEPSSRLDFGRGAGTKTREPGWRLVTSITLSISPTSCLTARYPLQWHNSRQIV